MYTHKHLPVYQHRGEILAALEKHQVIVVESPTGSGKTTQIPLILHENGYTERGIVGITQPRRIAALSVSSFIEKQLDAPKGFVGYKMRFNDTTESHTKIKVLTDGMLLMELKADPLLSDYSVILVDEAHERSLNIDFVLGLLYQVLQRRPECKVIVSSATINASVFSTYFSHAPIISIDARIHPVDIQYINSSQLHIRQSLYEIIATLVRKEMKNTLGDILIFLPGEHDIKECISYLYTSIEKKKALLLPLFGRLSKEEQERVFDPTPKGKTKIIVATNIAETSITIDGVTSVIDSGEAKINYYHQQNFTSSLVTLPISRSSCEQRAGRAGRTAPGTCYRLYSEEDYNQRPQYGTEEILRTDLSEVMLRMSELGIYDYEGFNYLSRPNTKAIQSAQHTLQILGAIDEYRMLTSVGTMMVAFPLLPRHSRALVESIMRYPSVLEEVIIAISFLSSKSPFILPQGEEDIARLAHQHFSSEQGDFVSYLHIYHLFRQLETKEKREQFCRQYFFDIPSLFEIHHVVEQLSEIITQMGIPITNGGSLRDYFCSLASGLLQYVCIKTGRALYSSLTAQKIFIHPGSAWFHEMPQYILAGEIVQTTRLYARTVSPLQKEWLDSISPHIRKQLHQGSTKVVKREHTTQKKSPVTQVVPKKSTKASNDSLILFGRHYVLKDPPKGKRPIAQIPLEDLSYLYEMAKKNNKKLPHVRATLLYKNFSLQEGHTLQSIFSLHGKLFPEHGIFETPPKGLFTDEDFPNLVDNLQWILSFCKHPKKRNQLGFIQLEYTKAGNYRFSCSSHGITALENSLYALGVLMDSTDQASYPQEFRQIKKLYAYYLSLLDTT